jgi:LysR family transcriptional regulator, hydrogen peroxide-inducible genes activator
MTIIQLEYLVAVDSFRHFAKAAEHCCVTQPTLSMQIQKLEEELGIKVFDRSKQPVVPTEIGQKVIAQARQTLKESLKIIEIVEEQKGSLSGELRLGIIPTLAPYLLPLFVNNFIQKYPSIHLKITELTTENLIQKLKNDAIDVGIAVTPLHDEALIEDPIFYEEFVAFVSENESAYQKEYILSEDLDINHLWLLEEGHCFRSQMLKICELRKQSAQNRNFEYQVGSIETLRRMVEVSGGITILPELSVKNFNEKQCKSLRYFKKPAPVREVSLITYRHFIKRGLIDALKMEIGSSIPQKMKKINENEVIEMFG